MKGDFQARFCENLRVQLPRVTRLAASFFKDIQPHKLLSSLRTVCSSLDNDFLTRFAKTFGIKMGCGFHGQIETSAPAHNIVYNVMALRQLIFSFFSNLVFGSWDSYLVGKFDIPLRFIYKLTHPATPYTRAVIAN